MISNSVDSYEILQDLMSSSVRQELSRELDGIQSSFLPSLSSRDQSPLQVEIQSSVSLALQFNNTSMSNTDHQYSDVPYLSCGFEVGNDDSLLS